MLQFFMVTQAVRAWRLFGQNNQQYQEAISMNNVCTQQFLKFSRAQVVPVHAHASVFIGAHVSDRVDVACLSSGLP